MARTRITGPPSRGRVKQLGLMGTGLVYLLLLLSTCLGQDAEGKRHFFSSPTPPFSIVLLSQSLFFPSDLWFRGRSSVFSWDLISEGCAQLSWQAPLPWVVSFPGSWVTTRVLWFIIYVGYRLVADDECFFEETSTTQSRGRAFIWNAHYSLSPTDFQVLLDVLRTQYRRAHTLTQAQELRRRCLIPNSDLLPVSDFCDWRLTFTFMKH